MLRGALEDGEVGGKCEGHVGRLVAVGVDWDEVVRVLVNARLRILGE